MNLASLVRFEWAKSDDANARRYLLRVRREFLGFSVPLTFMLNLFGLAIVSTVLPVSLVRQLRSIAP